MLQFGETSRGAALEDLPGFGKRCSHCRIVSLSVASKILVYSSKLGVASRIRFYEAIAGPEWLRSLFEQLPEYRQGQLSPVRIVQFSSTEQFAPYKSTDWEAGHYESVQWRDASVHAQSGAARTESADSLAALWLGDGLLTDCGNLGPSL